VVRALLVALLGVGACTHDDLVITAPEGPAPGRIDRAGQLRRHNREAERARRRRPREPMQSMPSGTPDIQRAFPWWNELVDAATVTHDDAGLLKARGDLILMLLGDDLVVVAIADGLRVVAREPLGGHQDSTLLLRGDQLIVVIPEVHHLLHPHQVELRRYTLAADGRLSRGSSVHLRSAFSFLGPRYHLAGDALLIHQQGPVDRLPRIRRAGRWQPLVRTADLQRPISADARELQAVVRCTLSDPFDCTARGIVAPVTFYVEADHDAFVAWTIRGVWRLPFTDAPATAVRISARPLDLLSWRLDDGAVDAVVETQDTDELALVHIPAATLRAGLATIPRTSFIPLAVADRSEVAARIVGDRVLHGHVPDWACHGPTTLHVRSLTDATTTALEIPHCISRIEPSGHDALILAAPHDRDDVPVQLTAVDLGSDLVGDTRTIAHAQASRVRTAGLYKLGAAHRGLIPAQDAPLPVVVHDGPRLTDLGGLPGRGLVAHAFSYAGRTFIVRDDELIELAFAADELIIKTRLALE